MAARPATPTATVTASGENAAMGAAAFRSGVQWAGPGVCVVSRPRPVLTPMRASMRRRAAQSLTGFFCMSAPDLLTHAKTFSLPFTFGLTVLAVTVPTSSHSVDDVPHLFLWPMSWEAE